MEPAARETYGRLHRYRPTGLYRKRLRGEPDSGSATRMLTDREGIQGDPSSAFGTFSPLRRGEGSRWESEAGTTEQCQRARRSARVTSDRSSATWPPSVSAGVPLISSRVRRTSGKLVERVVA